MHVLLLLGLMLCAEFFILEQTHDLEVLRIYVSLVGVGATADGHLLIETDPSSLQDAFQNLRVQCGRRLH